MTENAVFQHLNKKNTYLHYMSMSIKCGDHLSHMSGKWLYIHDLPRGSLRSLRNRNVTRLYPCQ